jgi:hypothetical protein
MFSLQNSINAPTPFAIADGGTGNSSALTSGQLWIGNTGNNPSIGNITPGAGITVTNGPGSIMIGSTGAAVITWNVTGITPSPPVNMLPNNGYLINTSGPISLLLPTNPTLGDTYYIIGSGSFTVTVPGSGYRINNAGLTGTVLSSPASGPFSNAASITLVCNYISASPLLTTWTALSTNGASFTVA